MPLNVNPLPLPPSQVFSTIFFFSFLKFIFRERGREGEREGEKHQCVGRLLRAPHRGPGLQPRHVHWLGIKLVTPRFAGWCSIHWATPARALPFLLNEHRTVFLVKQATLQFFQRGSEYPISMLPPKPQKQNKKKKIPRVPERPYETVYLFIFQFPLVGQWHVATMTQRVVIKTKESELLWKTFCYKVSTIQF